MTRRSAPPSPLPRRLALAASLVILLAAPLTAGAANGGGNGAAAFEFDVIGHSFGDGAGEAVLKRAIADANQERPAFVVATGIKAAREPCSDRLYAQRKAVLDESDAALIVALAGSDWTECLNSAGRSGAVERLNRLREVFFTDGQSLGARHVAVTRLSATAKFRSYAEYAHWQVGNVLFATINLPAANNHYRPEAGRNSEYEDRLVANRAWLHRLFTLAGQQKLDGVVLFSDGDIGLQAEESSFLSGFSARQDGFAEPRRQLKALAQKFKGKLLLVDARGTAEGAPAIVWHDNVGHLSLAAQSAGVRVNPGAAVLFTLKDAGADAAP
ncbi:hypothetical protein [Rugamonas sp.]|uniref:hypothetical protein n=1 Tax=Rugamonas sp. TaxID=1926287 RepID=UPI0025D15A3E|nr:hypothetical protein [Rugamonas sp.]